MANQEVHFGLLYDGSDKSKKALEECLLLAPRHVNSFLHVCTCVESPQVGPPFGYLPVQDEAEKLIADRKVKAEGLFQYVKDQVANASFQLTGVTYDIEVGDPRGYIISLVEKYNINFMFMGSRSYSGIAGYYS